LGTILTGSETDPPLREGTPLTALASVAEYLFPTRMWVVFEASVQACSGFHNIILGLSNGSFVLLAAEWTASTALFLPETVQGFY
jgi:hypothetical protein